jgi:hypothetical protein
LDLASKLDVDVKTIGRWEKGLSLIKPDKEDDVMEALFLPHQVIHNLNSEHAISIFYDFDTRTYSFSLLGTRLVDSGMFHANFPVENELIHHLSDKADIEFVHGIQALRTNKKAISEAVLKEAAKRLPDLNLVLFDQAGFYAGHIVFLPVKIDSYEKLKNKEKLEHELSLEDLTDFDEDEKKVFYFYSLYADSIANSYYLMTKALQFFKRSRFKNYIIAGSAYHEEGIKMHKEMGLKVLWEEKQDINSHPIRSFLEGDYDMFLFGTKL